MQWARQHLLETDYDVELLMLYLERSIQTDRLIGNETVIHFKFTDIENLSDWWIIATGQDIDICNKDPGKDVDIYFTSTVRTLVDIWMGDVSYRKAVNDDMIKVVGPRVLTNNIFSWINPSVFAGLPSAQDI